MSIDVCAAIVVGLSYDEFDDAQEPLLDGGRLERFAPDVNTPNEYCVYGLKYDRTCSWDILKIDEVYIAELSAQFKEITGKTAKVYLCC